MSGKEASPLKVAPARERGLKFIVPSSIVERITVAPARERGLKFSRNYTGIRRVYVAPARERGLKSDSGAAW